MICELYAHIFPVVNWFSYTSAWRPYVVPPLCKGHVHHQASEIHTWSEGSKCRSVSYFILYFSVIFFIYSFSYLFCSLCSRLSACKGFLSFLLLWTLVFLFPPLTRTLLPRLPLASLPPFLPRNAFLARLSAAASHILTHGGSLLPASLQPLPLTGPLQL